MKNNFKTSKKIKEIINNKNIPAVEKNYLIWLEGYDCGQAEEILNKHNIYSTKKQREKEKAELIQELGYDPDRDPMQDHWDHESDKIAVMQEFHDNETS